MTNPNSNCNKHPIRCGVLALENPNSLDTGTSGALTFKKSTIAAALGNLKVSIDRTYSFSKGTKYPASSYCSQYDNYARTSQSLNHSAVLSSMDTPTLITKKFNEIMSAKKLGGVIAWSLDEDSLSWDHLKAMQDGLRGRLVN
ncbi:hypothetical protein IFM47457_01761 [Aspergillus lentulus]|nr:hypothetical protein IFM47457_01761 [Aspergillus lentulus]